MDQSVKPRFKVGDRLLSKPSEFMGIQMSVVGIDGDSYILGRILDGKSVEYKAHHQIKYIDKWFNLDQETMNKSMIKSWMGFSDE